MISSFYPGAQIPFRQLDAQQLSGTRIGGTAQETGRLCQTHQGVTPRERGARIGRGEARAGGAQPGAQQRQPMPGLRRGQTARAALRRRAPRVRVRPRGADEPALALGQQMARAVEAAARLLAQIVAQSAIEA